MSDYLSIGEVAKLKCITVKALRYYEKIGIFIPAYINEETGYRYYKTEQMVVLDFILTCLELGIPLKQFPNYLDINGELNIDLILKDGMNTAAQEIERINRTAQKLKNMSDHMEESEEITKNASSFKRFIHQRYLLVKPIKELHPTHKKYISLMTELYFQKESKKYIGLYNQGLLYLSEDKKTSAFAYNEVAKADGENIMVLPSGYYKCKCFEGYNENNRNEIMELINENKSNNAIFIQERYCRHLSNEPFLEIQISV